MYIICISIIKGSIYLHLLPWNVRSMKHSTSRWGLLRIKPMTLTKQPAGPVGCGCFMNLPVVQQSAASVFQQSSFFCPFEKVWLAYAILLKMCWIPENATENEDFFQVAKVKQIFRVQCTRDDEGKPLVQVEREARRCTSRFGAKWPRFRMIQPDSQDDPPRRVKSTLSKQTLYWYCFIFADMLSYCVWILLVGLVCDLHQHPSTPPTSVSNGTPRWTSSNGNCWRPWPMPATATSCAGRSQFLLNKTTCLFLLDKKWKSNFWEFEHFDN